VGTPAILLVVAIALPVTGVAALRVAWQLPRGHRLRLPADLAGWALVAAGVGTWMAAGGPDRGVVIAVLVFMLAGLACLVAAGRRDARGGGPLRRRTGRLDGDRTGKSPVEVRRRAIAWAWVVLLAGPIAGVGAFATGLAVQLGLLATGWHPANALAAVLLWVPLAWTTLAVVSTTQARLAGRSTVVCGIALAGLATALALPGVTA
jgi:hypothetical protein